MESLAHFWHYKGLHFEILLQVEVRTPNIQNQLFFNEIFVMLHSDLDRCEKAKIWVVGYKHSIYIF